MYNDEGATWGCKKMYLTQSGNAISLLKTPYIAMAIIPINKRRLSSGLPYRLVVKGITFNTLPNPLSTES